MNSGLLYFGVQAKIALNLWLFITLKAKLKLEELESGEELIAEVEKHLWKVRIKKR